MAELAAAAASPVIKMVVKKLASELWDELGLVWSVYTDIKELPEQLSRIQNVLDDAEKKSMTNPTLQGWLRKLRDAALDLEDAMEEFEAETLRRRMERHDDMVGKVRDFFSSNNLIAFRCRMACKIKEIRKRFDKIEVEMIKFRLAGGSISERTLDRETFSSVIESEIYGRDDDKKEVIEFLVDKDNDKNISILSIVGLGGVGKTALAQLVYNNERINEQFELRMWVCVGENFDVKMIMQKMIEQVKGEQGNFSSLETMSSFLQGNLRTKRFLLVLDDIWNDKKLEWEKLRPLFIHAKLGSKIIVTTRIETVASAASTIGTISVHKLQGLQDDDCWTLFKQRAFRFEREEDNPELVEIGWKIMKKCGGLPLAAMALGSLMSDKRTEDEWLAVKNNEIWNLFEDEIGILPALKLSYDHLPSHLKRCFTYCAVFPKDYKFEIKRLIQLWMAEGLIDTSDTSQNSEDIGKEYFNKLLWRSFFQDVKMDYYNNPMRCKMHDLVHDLVCSITKDEALVMEDGTRIISPECRYLSAVRSFKLSTNLKTIYKAKKVEITSFVGGANLKTIYKAKKLRSLLLLGGWSYFIADSDEIFLNITKNFTQIRALGFSPWELRKLSDKISRLKHLRFLDLSNTQIATLPTSITRLYNLQTLNLQNCYKLQELPEGISNLSNLRHIDISKCTQIATLPTSITGLYNLRTLNLNGCKKLQELPEGISNLSNLRHMDLQFCDKLSCVPRYLGRLSNLETLSMFIVAQENGRTITELQHLNSIRGGLEIKNLHNVKDANEAMQANLVAKTRLNYLILNWYEGRYDPREPSSIKVEVAAGVLERLQPHHNLRDFAIYNYIGTRLPNWITSSLPNLVKLTLRGLKRCEHLPSLGRLPLLKHLTIHKMHAVEIIGDEFYGDGDSSSAFPLLEELYLRDMPNLEEWHTEPTTTGRNIASFPHLSKLRIASCPKLMMRPSIPCSVEDLEIWMSNEMLLSAGSLAGLSKLKKLQIWGCGVSSSSSSGWWDGLQYLTALEKLDISHCDELTCLPEGIMYLPSLNTLHLCGNRNWRSLEEGGRKQQQQPTPFFPGLQDLRISYNYALTALPEWVGGLTSLQNLSIERCPNLAMLPDGLQYLTNLQRLRIKDCLQPAMLSDGLQYLTTLQGLSISDLPQLTRLPDGLQHLTALRSLSISDLPQLTILPDGLQHLTALEDLSVNNCPQVVRRCKREMGEDWHKIAHIPHIYINPKEGGEERSTFTTKFLGQLGCACFTGHT